MELGQLGDEQEFTDFGEQHAEHDTDAVSSEHLFAVQSQFRPRRGAPNPLNRLPDAEYQRLKAARLCYECKQPGHIGRDCPKRLAKSARMAAVESGATVLKSKNEQARQE